MAARLKERWQAAYSGENYGQVAVLQNGLEYKPFSQTAVDSQLIEQDKRTTELICAVFHVPACLVDSSHAPPYGNAEQLLQQYYSQCLQTLMTSLETSLDEGLELPAPYGTEFDIEDLYYMDTATRTKAAHDAIASGALSPNEARARYFDVGPVTGGDSPMVQQQYYSLGESRRARCRRAVREAGAGGSPSGAGERRRGRGERESVSRIADEKARGYRHAA